MTKPKTLAFALMDAPFESTRVVSAIRLIQAALEQGCHVQVFAYEGAVFLPFAAQKAHPNAFHSRSVEQEAHPLSRQWVQELADLAQTKGLTLDWVNCGFCVDERGAEPAIAATRRGSPADLFQFTEAAFNTLVIPTK